MKAIHVGAHDTVATAITDLKPGDEALGVVIKEPIPTGHKFATAFIKKGDPVIKYDSHIGTANTDIEPGMWVHVHNLDGERGRGDVDDTVRDIDQDVDRSKLVAHSDTTYKLTGYRRGDGSFGFRNHVLILPTVHCANKVTERIANAVRMATARNGTTRMWCM